METFRESITLAHSNRPKHPIALEAIVDTGATYSWVPQEVLKRLGIKPQEIRPLRTNQPLSLAVMLVPRVRSQPVLSEPWTSFHVACGNNYGT